MENKKIQKVLILPKWKEIFLIKMKHRPKMQKLQNNLETNNSARNKSHSKRRGGMLETVFLSSF